MLAAAGQAWRHDKPEVWAPVLTAFLDYASTFGGVAHRQAQGPPISSAQWQELIADVLIPAAQAAKSASDRAASGLRSHLQSFRDIQPLLEKSIDQGWAELASEESEMVAIAQQLGRLEDQVESLQDSISAAEISQGQDVVTSTVQTLYNIATEVGESFSFLSMFTAAFTVGKTYYDVITATEEVADTLQQIGELQIQASQEAQAAAGTKLVLRLVYDLELALGSIIDVLPLMSTMWAQELDKLRAAQAALIAGVDPASYLELLTVPTANANWQAISGFALAVSGMKGSQGPPVVLNPQNPLPVQG
jgi:hypothetical protein